MTAFANRDELASALDLSKVRLIAIDGFQGSGKTTFAKYLASIWQIPLVSADNYLNRNQGAFFSALRLNEIAESIPLSGPCLFEGVCALQILEAINTKPDILIYVKRMAIWGWADEDDLIKVSRDGVSTSADPLNPLQVAMRGLWREVALYHNQYCPHVNANLIYERSEA